MHKKIVSLTILAAVTALSFAGTAWAEELSTGEVVVDAINDVEPTAVVTSDQPDAPAQDTEPAAVPTQEIMDAVDECNTTGNCEDLENIEHAGTSGEAEVVCANDEEEDCEIDETEEIEEVVEETWPLIVSLSALGATVVIVILLNLLGKRKK